MNKKLMRKSGYGEEMDLVDAGKCPFCKKDISITDFKSSLSKREFSISGLCQKCQDEIFGKD
jgi:hypothetical protein